MENKYKLQKYEVYNKFARVYNYKLNKKHLKRISLVTAGMVLTQMLIGNHGSFFLAAPSVTIASVETIRTFKKCKNYGKTYKEDSNCLDNITNELILLGYDLKQDALQKAEYYDLGIIKFKDKYDNDYLFYEDDSLNYFIENDSIRTKECTNYRQNVTEQVIKGVNKSKQDK